MDYTSSRIGLNYEEYVCGDLFDSFLEIPNGRDPYQNAWLTIEIVYSIDFADSRNQVAGLIFKDGNRYVAKDLDGKYFPVQDWDMQSQISFNRRFRRGEGFWNRNFLLLTPNDYAHLDYEALGAGKLCRPNVLCLFRLQTVNNFRRESFTHLPLKVVRIAKDISGEFRSSHKIYDTNDSSKTIHHELGHCLNQLHIKALFGEEKCIFDDINAAECYDTPEGMDENIMGRGTALDIVNAKPWMERIEKHTKISKVKWTVTKGTDLPPRIMPLAFKGGLLPKNW